MTNKTSGIWTALATFVAGLGTITATLLARGLDSVDKVAGVASVIITVVSLLGGLFAQAHEFRILRQRATGKKREEPPSGKT